ncbi:MAG: hypothetical protein M3Z97_01505 [Candidatus Dormibacteraeota bacterium]|nr:hypothetical protein [Candidatus Dormibacteraeota bacterium]
MNGLVTPRAGVSLRTAGLACILGALITIGGGIATQLVAASTDVSRDVYSYPYHADVHRGLSVLWAATHALIFVGLLGFLQSGLAGSSRTARMGLMLALAGTALLFVGEFASMAVAERPTSGGIASAVDALFGIASLLTAGGLLAAGWATVRARRWSGWRRLTPLACGLWSLALIGFVFTDVRMSAIAVYGLCFLAFGIGLFTSGQAGQRADRLDASTAGTST